MEIERPFYLQQLIDRKDNGRVKIITGIRRCGKSYLLFTLYYNYLLTKGIHEDQIIMLSLDDPANMRYRNPLELLEYCRSRTSKADTKYYIFLDEIQFVESVDNPYVKNATHKITFLDAVIGIMKIRNTDVYVTGSNSFMLSSDVLTQFRDRGDEIRIYPLSFAEFWGAYNKAHSGASLPSAFPMNFQAAGPDSAWNEYCMYGGMPQVFKLDTHEKKSRYLEGLLEDTYMQDIIERNKVANDSMILTNLLRITASSIGSLTNPARIANTFRSELKANVASATIGRYLEYFQNAFILELAQRYDVKGRKYLSTPYKCYFTDIGLRNAILGFRQQEMPHIMENIIYCDLRRRGYNVDVGNVIVNNTDATGKKIRTQLEVDFVVNSGNNRYYIQSALNTDDPDKKKQETEPLRRIKDSFKKIIIVRDQIVPWHDDDGILYIGVIQFLLDKNAMNL